MANKEIIPVFFAADECYTPFLAVALTSIKKYASADRQYQIHVLCTGIDEEKQKSVLAMQTENIKIRFENISEKASQIYDVMRCRDYYTSAIYYRLFIPDLFPQYDKAIYLDCDTVLLEDIAILFDKEIGDNFIGAVADQAVSAVPQFREYTKNALDVDAEEYFNSGVIVLNLKQLRAIDFYKTFYGRTPAPVLSPERTAYLDALLEAQRGTGILTKGSHLTVHPGRERRENKKKAPRKRCFFGI